MKKARHLRILKTIGTSFCVLILALSACIRTSAQENRESARLTITAADILGNPEYPAISYSGYREKTRDITPTVEQIKEDLRILSAMGIKLIRTYDVARPMAANTIKAIRALHSEDPDFEMYLMLGIWIDCKNAWTDKPPVHNLESEDNAAEVERAIRLAKENPDIVKILAVGNEAMVKWAAAYYVEPYIILKWVMRLQKLKAEGELPADLWITSSDNFASWGGGGKEYHTPELNALIKAVDYISMHSYPMHDTHYNPQFWLDAIEEGSAKIEQIEKSMSSALAYTQSQFQAVKDYMQSIGIEKPIHIGETGWASHSNGFYGPDGSKACDEYKQALYYEKLRQWTRSSNISCFFFEAFDEPWKDSKNPGGSENHFGLFTVDGKAKHAVWQLVDNGTFDGLMRDGNTIKKTFDGSFDKLIKTVVSPDGK